MKYSIPHNEKVFKDLNPKKIYKLFLKKNDGTFEFYCSLEAQSDGNFYAPGFFRASAFKVEELDEN